MKILHIIRTVDPEGGGPIEGIKQLGSIIEGLGHVVQIASLDGPKETFVGECPFTVHALGPGMGKYGYNRNFKPWLMSHAADYDAVVIDGIWQYHSFAAHNVLKRKNIPYFLFTHGMLDPWFKHQYPLKHFKKLLYWVWGEYPVLRDAKRVLFTCEEEKIVSRRSFRLYRCNEYVVNYGTAGHRGDIEEQRRIFLQRFPQLQDKRFLLFLSRIHPKKGVDLLIEAFAQTVDSQSDLHLVIAGPDQVGWQNELQTMAKALGIAKKITWTGMLKDDMKWGAYQAAEAFILPSHQENFGIVVAEALSCSLPVLISDKVNIWQEIVKDNAGLVAADTLNDTMALINRWQNIDASTKSEMSRCALCCFLNRFEISKAARSLLDQFDS